MDDVKNLVPTGKADIERASAAVQAGYPMVGSILGELTEWLRDYNWPVAHVLAPFLASLGAPMVPHIRHVLRSNDDVWKYWMIALILPSLPESAAAEFRPELQRLCDTPTGNERQQELDQQARNVLDRFGWLRAPAGKMQYTKVIWKHRNSYDPVEIYSELDDARWEVRRVEIFGDGSADYATRLESPGRTFVSSERFPPLSEIRANPEFVTMEIPREDFEKIWSRATK